MNQYTILLFFFYIIFNDFVGFENEQCYMYAKHYYVLYKCIMSTILFSSLPTAWSLYICSRKKCNTVFNKGNGLCLYFMLLGDLLLPTSRSRLKSVRVEHGQSLLSDTQYASAATEEVVPSVTHQLHSDPGKMLWGDASDHTGGGKCHSLFWNILFKTQLSSARDSDVK